jgi:hypothetical protein
VLAFIDNPAVDVNCPPVVKLVLKTGFKVACDLHICDGKVNDISKLKDECFSKYKNDTDILFAGFPCFVKDTLVLTNNGYKEIQNVSIEDKLLTHTGVFQNIVNLQRKIYNGSIYNFKVKYHPEPITCTEEHPFYVRKQRKIWNNLLRRYEYSYDEPEWINAKLIKNDHVFGMVINTNIYIPSFVFEKNKESCVYLYFCICS